MQLFVLIKELINFDEQMNTIFQFEILVRLISNFLNL